MGADLEYVGGGAYAVGWPACDHYEPDDELAALKVASGLYRYRRKAEEGEREGQLAGGKKESKGGR